MPVDTTKKETVKYTVVQHSAYGYQQKPGWEQGLETRRVSKVKDQQAIEKAGGLLLNTYGEAEDFAEQAMYPPGVEGLYPAAAGTFASLKIDGLAIYIPVRQTAVLG